MRIPDVRPPDSKQTNDFIFLPTLGDRLDLNGRVAPFVFSETDDAALRIFKFPEQNQVTNFEICCDRR